MEDNMSMKLLVRCEELLFDTTSGGSRDVYDLISETKEVFPEASLDILNELFNVGNAFNHSLLSVQRQF